MVKAEDYICCCGFKIWTRVISWLGLVGCIVAVLNAVGVAAAWSAGEDGEKQNVWTGLIIAIVVIIVGLALVAQILLLVGNEKEKADFLTPWLTSAWISVVLLILGVVGLMITGAGIPRIFVSVCQLITSGYAIFVVHQRRKEIRDNGYVQQEPGV